MRFAQLRQWLDKPFVLFTLIMLPKLYLVKSVLFPDGPWWLPLTTDLPAIWIVFCLIEWWARKRKFGAYLIADLVMTCIYFAVIMYYKYFGIIVTYHALQQIGQVTEVQGSVMQLLHPYYLFIFIDVAVFLLLLVSRRFRAWCRQWVRRLPLRPVQALLIASLIICLANVWQGWRSMNELKKSENMGIIPYQTVEIAAGAGEAIASIVSEPDLALDVTPEAIAARKNITPVAEPLYEGIAKGKNLIVIQLEAFQNFLLHTRVGGEEVTPNLNRLLDEVLYFPHFYQMVGQGNTSDAEYVVNTSFYIPLHGAASQVYGDRLLPGMPRVLAENGYVTATFHTNDVKFWNRDALYGALGFQAYYDQTYFGDEDVVFFGASDEVLYAKTLDRLLEMQASGKPFYAQIISMSSHHPFNLPDRKITFGLPESYADTLVGDYIQAQHYADHALGQMIGRLKETGLWENSVVVIYGDHMGLPIYSLSGHELALMEEMLGRPYTTAEMLNIPLIISVPGMDKAAVLPQVGGQVDIYPTVANLLGISLRDKVHFGQDLLNHSRNLLPQRYYLPSGSFINDAGIFVPGESFDDGEFRLIYGLEAVDDGVTRTQYDQALELLEMSDRLIRSLPKLN